jgi:phage N-6-adenine-methyltransferase
VDRNERDRVVEMSGASFHRGESVQEIGTPKNFLFAVQNRFGLIKWDLAATFENQVADSGYFLGTGSEIDEDSLKKDWITLSNGVRWLNPPFHDITPWAEKCATQRGFQQWTLMLVPASVGTNWWAEHVHNKAMVYFLSPRLTFVGSTTPYPKDLALCAYGYGAVGYTTWRWK